MASFLSACTSVTGGVAGEPWPNSLLYVSVNELEAGDPAVPCKGGVSYDLTSTNLRQSATVANGLRYTSNSGIFLRGAPYALEAICLDADGRETGRSRLSGVVPVNGTTHPPFTSSEAPFTLSIHLRQGPERTIYPSYVQKCDGQSQGVGAPCIDVAY
jgi:hypothetical protein